MLLLGLGPGEAAELTWADVDTVAGVLHVAGARKWTPDGYVLGPPETPRAKRALKMPGRLVTAFEKMERGGHHDLVFPSPSGKLWGDSAMRTRLARLCERAEIPQVTPYELHLTAASLLSDAGVPIEIVADLLGHSTTQLLESVHRHPSPQGRRSGAVVKPERHE